MIGGGLFVVVAAIIGFLSTQSADTYNDWANSVRPVLLQQDALLQEVQGTQDAVMATAIPGFLQRSLALQAQLQSAVPGDEEIAVLHQHMVARAVSIHSGLGLLQQAVNSNDRSIIETARNHFNQAGAHLQAFLGARQAYLDRHGLHME